jgi:hypothetical protein
MPICYNGATFPISNLYYSYKSNVKPILVRNFSNLRRFFFMQRQILQTRSRFSLIACGLLVILMLTACSTGSSNTTIAKTKLKPTPTPSLTMYQGDGYSIGYPQGWAVKGKGSLVTFTDAQGLTAFIVEETPNPNGAIPPTTAVSGGLNGFKVQGTNFQSVDITPTLTLGGNTWNQGAAIADTAANGQTNSLKLVVLSSDYPQRTASTQTFTLIYSTPTKEFDQANTQSFQPMLQSFKFV